MTLAELTTYLSREADSNRPLHALVLEGANTDALLEASYAFAERLLGRREHPDLAIITHEKPTIISIDEIREQLVDDIVIRPYVSPYKIYIIPDAELIGQPGQNALLKTLEEPPAYGVIILITTSSAALLETIRSRCVNLSLDCEQKKKLAGETLYKVTSLADRLIGRQMADISADVKEITAMVKEEGIAFADIFDTLKSVVRDAIVLREGGTTKMVPEAKLVSEKLAKQDEKKLFACMAALTKAEWCIRANVNTENALKEMFLEMQ